MKKPITCSALALLCGTLSAPLVMTFPLGLLLVRLKPNYPKQSA